MIEAVPLSYTRLFLLGAFAASLACLAATTIRSIAGPAVRPIVGNIDGIAHDGEQTFVSGWACQQGRSHSIAVRIFRDPSRNALLTAGMANLPNEPAVAAACRDDAGGRHRFFIVLPIGFDQVSALGVEGFILGGPEKATLAGSGKPLVLHERLNAPFPVPPPPRLAGAYHKRSDHPGVFMTGAELKDAAVRTNRPGSYSSERFGQLINAVAHELVSGIDWDATYSGCIGDIYQYAFAFEPQNGKDAIIRAALHVPDGAKTPAGGAIVASRLALYAALVKAGATVPKGAPPVDQAVALAKRILLAWADRGFPRDADGRFRPLSALACEENGKVTLLGAEAPALAIARGITFSVHAQDLLESLDTLDASEKRRLGAFHTGIFELVRQSENLKFGYGGVPFPSAPLGRFNNVDAGALASLLAIARLEDEERKFNAVLYGDDPTIPMALPWWRFFDRAIYGENDHPLECSLDGVLCPHNPRDPDKYPYFQTAAVFPGEVVDRHRNEHAANSFGYSMGVLRALVVASENMRLAGIDAFAYRGAHRQSIEMAIRYYACFGREAGFYKIVTPENAGKCPNVEQYDGKLVNDLDRMVIYGTYRFPGDDTIISLDAEAKRASRPFLVDPVLFGRWRD
jgi:hypothetical protein